MPVDQVQWVGLKGAASYANPGEASTAANGVSKERSEPRESRERSERDLVGACSDGGEAGRGFRGRGCRARGCRAWTAASYSL